MEKPQEPVLNPSVEPVLNPSIEPVLNPSIEPDHPEHVKNHKPRKEDYDLPPTPKDHTSHPAIQKGVIKNIKDCPFKKKEHPEGFLVSSLPPSERKAYLQYNQDHNHECWTREDYHIDKIEVERKKTEQKQKDDAKKQKDNEDKVISQAETIATLCAHITSLTNRLDRLESKK
jgi:hypothetical protein